MDQQESNEFQDQMPGAALGRKPWCKGTGDICLPAWDHVWGKGPGGLSRQKVSMSQQWGLLSWPVAFWKPSISAQLGHEGKGLPPSLQHFWEHIWISRPANKDWQSGLGSAVGLQALYNWSTSHVSSGWGFRMWTSWPTRNHEQLLVSRRTEKMQSDFLWRGISCRVT